MSLMEMRTSERGSLKRCALQWYWSTVEGLAPVRAANPLWFGIAVHDAMAQWYLKGLKRGPHPAETFDAALEGERSVLVTNEDEEKEYVDARQMGIDMMNRYVLRYGEDPSWDVIAVERSLQAILPQPARVVFGVNIPERKRAIRYYMTWDGVYRDLATGEIWLMEHKTAASIRVDHLPLDDQAGSYWALATPLLRKAGVLGPKEEIAGINYNFLRKAPDDPRPVNSEGLRLNKATTKQHYLTAFESLSLKDLRKVGLEISDKLTMAKLQEIAENLGLEVHGDVSASQPPEYFLRWPVYRSRSERKRMIERIQSEAFYAEAYRSGDLPIVKTPDKQWCNYCAFKRVCEMDEVGDQAAVEELKASQFVHRSAYEPYEKKSAE